MVSPNGDTNDSQTALGWDFESALELIRFQTAALELRNGESHDVTRIERSGASKPEHSANALSFPSLGNFEEVLKHFASSKKTTSEDEAIVACTVDDAAINKAVSARPEPQTSSEKHQNVSAKKQDRDLESQDRRKVIQNLVGLSDEERVTKQPAKGKVPSSPITKANLLNNGRDPEAKLAGPDKKLQIMELLFGDAKKGALVAHLASSAIFPARQAGDKNLHVFVDISNILIGFHDALKRIRGIPKDVRIPRERLCFFNFSLVLERGRSISKRVLAGSDDLESVEEARQLGYEINLLQRVYKHKDPSSVRNIGRKRRDITSGESESDGRGPSRRRVEQGVDEILHLKMLESIVDTEIPSVIVLASGDAAEAEYSGGFLRMVERALARGWSVEIVAFRENLSAMYRNAKWLERWGTTITVIELDPFAELLRLD